MIAATPLPSFGHLLALPYLSAPAGKALAAPWLRDGDLNALWLSRSSWSLVVLAETFRLAHGRAPVVAVPEYICNQSLWPLRQAGATLVFYPVRDDQLSPNFPACEALGRIDLFLLVHYFGWPNQAAEARVFCDSRGAWLIEDAAHVLAPIAGIGEHGDAVLYSPHKLLAAPDGAVLVAREGLRAVESHLSASVRAIGCAHPKTTGWRMKRLLQRTPLGPLLARLRSSSQPDFDSDPATTAMARKAALSHAAAALISRADLANIAEARTTNAQALLAAIEGRAAWEPVFRVGNDTPPYRLVMRCTARSEATRLFDRLRGARLPVESWPDLPPEVGDGMARHLRHTLLLLPCHQSLDPHVLAKAAKRALEAA